MVGEIDADGNGDIDFDGTSILATTPSYGLEIELPFLLTTTEFVAVMSRKVNTNYSAEQVRQAFRVRRPSDRSIAAVAFAFINSRNMMLEVHEDVQLGIPYPLRLPRDPPRSFVLPRSVTLGGRCLRHRVTPGTCGSITC
jgi:hypothetical protein